MFVKYKILIKNLRHEDDLLNVTMTNLIASYVYLFLAEISSALVILLFRIICISLLSDIHIFLGFLFIYF